MRFAIVLLAAALLDASCRDAAPAARTPTIVWRPLGSWSGRGSMQTDPFLSDTGSLRLRWETRNEANAGTGTFRLTVHSDVSGRPLIVSVDGRGPGHDVAYVSEDPRSFFLAVESANVEWTLAADEGVAASRPRDQREPQPGRSTQNSRNRQKKRSALRVLRLRRRMSCRAAASLKIPVT